MRTSDIELMALGRNQKRQMKEAEDSHNEDMKQSLKKIQSDQASVRADSLYFFQKALFFFPPFYGTFSLREEMGTTHPDFR